MVRVVKGRSGVGSGSAYVATGEREMTRPAARNETPRAQRRGAGKEILPCNVHPDVVSDTLVGVGLSESIGVQMYI